MTRQLDAAFAVLDDCCKRRDEWIEAHLRTAEECHCECCAVSSGQIERELELGQACVEKLWLKQDQYIQLQIGAAYHAWRELGGTIPDDVTVSANLDSPPSLADIVTELVQGRVSGTMPEQDAGSFSVRPAPLSFPGQPGVPVGPELVAERRPAEGPRPCAVPDSRLLGGLIDQELKAQLARNGDLLPPEKEALRQLAGILGRPDGAALLGRLAGDALRRAGAEGAGPGRPGQPAGQAGAVPVPAPPIPPPVPRFPPRDPAAERKAKEEQADRDRQEREAEKQRLQPGAVPDWCRILDYRTAHGAASKVTAPGWTDAVSAFLKSLPLGLDRIIQSLDGLVKAAAGFTPFVAGCKSQDATGIARFAALANGLSQWLGIEYPGVNTSLRQTLNALCPQQVPTIDQAQQLYLQAPGGKRLASTWWAANGFCPDLQAQIADLARTRPNVGEAISLRLRGTITEGELDRRLAALGVSELDDRLGFRALADFIPPPTDLVSFMVRDVADQRVVDKYGYDEEFHAKFAGKVKAWANAQGMTEEQFLFNWRAHWRLVSPTQGFEMLHRLRPGAVPQGIETTEADILQLLEIDDYPQYWRERLMAISYAPLTRVDVQRAYFIGALKLPEVTSAYLDLGYAKPNADRLTEFTRRLRVRWIRGQLGMPGPAALAGMFAEGIITHVELVQEIRDYGFDAVDVQLASAEAQKKQERAFKKRLIAAARSRFLTGMVLAGDASAALQRAGVDPGTARALVRQWEAERELLGRHVTAAQLCRMANLGVVNAEEYQLALMRLGFRAREAGRLAALCRGTKEAKDKRAVRKLSPAQLCEAFQAERLTMPRFVAKLRELGFDDEGALIVASACKAAKEADPDVRRLTPAQLCQSFAEGDLDAAGLRASLKELGFAPSARELLAKQCERRKDLDSKRRRTERQLSGPQLCKAYKQGLLGPAAFLGGMAELGYSAEDARLLANECALDLGKEQRQQLAAAVKDFLAGAEKGRKEKKAAVKEAVAADEKARAAQEKRLKELAAAREKSQKALQKAIKEQADKPAEEDLHEA